MAISTVRPFGQQDGAALPHCSIEKAYRIVPLALVLKAHYAKTIRDARDRAFGVLASGAVCDGLNIL